MANQYWVDKNIVEFDAMLEYLRNDVVKYFYDIFREKPEIIRVTNWTRDVGWYQPLQVHLEDGWIIEHPPHYVIFFDKEMVLNWNGKYVPRSMGNVFSL